MSDASRVQFLYSKETAFDEVPPGTLTMQALRFVSENLKHTNATVVSAEIRADRMRSDLLLLGTDVAGDIAFEFSHGSFDDFIEAALCGAWTSNVLKNGVLLKSFLFERGLLDVGQYFSYRGSCINGFHLDISARAIAKGTFNVMGSEGFDGTASQATTVTPPTVSTVITSGPSITGIELNTNMTGMKATQVRLDLTNNMRPRPDVESRKSAPYGLGAQDVTGTVLFYFQNLAVFDAFKNNLFQPFTFVVHDPDTPSKSYTFFMPKVKFTDVEVVTPGLEQDIIATAGFRALADAAAGCHLQITRSLTLMKEGEEGEEAAA